MSGSVKEKYMASARSSKPLIDLALLLAAVVAGVVVATSDSVAVIRGVSMVVIILFAIGAAISFRRAVERDEQRIEKEWAESQARTVKPSAPAPTVRSRA